MCMIMLMSGPEAASLSACATSLAKSKVPGPTGLETSALGALAVAILVTWTWLTRLVMGSSLFKTVMFIGANSSRSVIQNFYHLTRKGH